MTNSKDQTPRAKDVVNECIRQLITKSRALILKHRQTLGDNPTNASKVFKSGILIWDQTFNHIVQLCKRSQAAVLEQSVREEINEACGNGLNLLMNYKKIISETSEPVEDRELKLYDLWIKIGDLLVCMDSCGPPRSETLASYNLKVIILTFLNAEPSVTCEPRMIAYDRIAERLEVEGDRLNLLLASAYFGLRSIQIAKNAVDADAELKKSFVSNSREMIAKAISSRINFDEVNGLERRYRNDFFQMDFRTQQIQYRRRLSDKPYNKYAKPLKGLRGVIMVFLEEYRQCIASGCGLTDFAHGRIFSDFFMEALCADEFLEPAKSLYLIACILYACLETKQNSNGFACLAEFVEPVCRACFCLQASERSEKMALVILAMMMNLWTKLDQQINGNLIADFNKIKRKWTAESDVLIPISEIFNSKMIAAVANGDQTMSSFTTQSLRSTILKIFTEIPDQLKGRPSKLNAIYRIRRIIIDTNSVMSDSGGLSRIFDEIDAECLIPNVVVSELQNLAKSGKTTMPEARNALEWIEQQEKLNKLRICNDHHHSTTDSGYNDEQILDCVRFCEKKCRDLYRNSYSSVLLTNDLNLRNKARAERTAAMKASSLLAFISKDRTKL